MFFNDINLISVLAAAVASMVIGFVWYSPWAFGPAWMKSLGMTPESMAKKGGDRSMGLTYATSFALSLLAAYVLAALFNSLLVTSVGGMAFVGVLMWLGFSVPMKVNDYLFADQGIAYVAITSGYQLVSLVVMALVTGLYA